MKLEIDLDSFREVLKRNVEQIVDKAMKEDKAFKSPNCYVTKENLVKICMDRFVFGKPYYEVCLYNFYDEAQNRYSIPTIRRYCKIMKPYMDSLVVELNFK